MIIKKNYDISNVSFIKVGGIVNSYIVIEEVKELLSLKDDFIPISNTSKILFAFDYLDTNVVKFNKSKIVFFKDSYFIYSGTSLSYCYEILKEKGLSGFEYISTIPGLLGGSIVNNASFLNEQISDNIIKVLIYHNNKFYFISKKDCEFNYRSSNLKQNSLLVVGALFKNVYLSKEKLIKRHRYGVEYRKKYQGEFNKTLGSTFKNKDDIIVGKVLDELGYKGFTYSNNVKISKNHANFIVVENKTNFLEIYTFIEFIKKLLYYYLGENISLEINVITDGRN